MRVSRAFLVSFLLLGVFPSSSSAAETKACKQLYTALELYRAEEEAYSTAFKDDLSIQRESSELLRKLSTQRVSMREARAGAALEALKLSLSATEAGKDWKSRTTKELATTGT